MKTLVTNADNPVAQLIIARLAHAHQVRAFDSEFTHPSLASVEYVRGDLREPDAARVAVDGVDAILHLSPLLGAETHGNDETTALDHATRGTFVLLNAARQQGVSRIILASSLDLFERFPAHYRINEAWRPRPTPSTADLSAWLAELSARENARAGELEVVCLRFGRIVGDAQIQEQPYDSRWLHIDDAVHAIQQAITLLVNPPANGHRYWRLYHISAPGKHTKVRMEFSSSIGKDLGYQPTHLFSQEADVAPIGTARVERWEDYFAAQPVEPRPIRKVLILGAGGPVAAVVARELAQKYRLRLADVRNVGDVIAEAKPQMQGAPLPTLLGAPHEYVLVDVRDQHQVARASAGMDAIINLTVLRHDPADAFRVNTLGAINVMRAAVANGIRRVVHTGPLMHGTAGPGDFMDEYDLSDDAPPRPYNQLYIHSKFLGQEACQVFADYYALEVPTLLFAGFINPVNAGSPSSTFAVTWEDSARAIRCALEVSTLPSSYEVFNITSDLPQGRYTNAKAKRLLGWQPRDRLVHHWSDIA